MQYFYPVKSRLRSKRAAFFAVVFALFAIGAVSGWYFWKHEQAIKQQEVQAAQAAAAEAVFQPEKKPEQFEKISRPKPAPVSMERVKKQGCVTDGLLSEYNPDWQKFAALVNRSNCYYLHRAIETWLKPPDFETIEFQIGQITKKDVVYGLFIAEAIDERKDYFDNLGNKKFEFEKMCRPGSEGMWGPHTCKADFSREEYRKYVSYITHRAIDLGVQSFMFGQIYMQESTKQDYAPRIVKDIRDYAKKQGVDVIIGAQTNGITDPQYLQLFDFIEGGVGIDQNGKVENGPCLSKRGGCWALLWHEDFSSKAKNVLLHLDWSGIKSDDLDIFARMDQSTRATTLENLYQKFTSQNMGFLMPMFGVLDKDNGGCRGPKRNFYSADNAYTCKDESVINYIISSKRAAANSSKTEAAKSPSLLKKIENYFKR